MDRVEVVCVTMGQKDLTIADKMHITMISAMSTDMPMVCAEPMRSIRMRI